MGGSYKRNWEGDYRCAPREVRAMLREQAADETPATQVADGQPMSDLDYDSVRAYRRRYDIRHEGAAWTGKAARLGSPCQLRTMWYATMPPRLQLVGFCERHVLA